MMAGIKRYMTWRYKEIIYFAVVTLHQTFIDYLSVTPKVFYFLIIEFCLHSACIQSAFIHVFCLTQLHLIA